MKFVHMKSMCRILCVVLFFSSCAEKKTTGKAPNSFPVISLKSIDTSLFQSYVADIQAVQNVEIRNRVTGFLEKIYSDEGQAVKKGQLLFRIEDKQYKEDVAKAKASLSIAIADAKSAELELERVKLLVDKKVITASELKVAEAKITAARARIQEMNSSLSNAQTKLSYTMVYAPFNGIINRIPYKVGSLLQEGDLLTTASDISAVFCYFNISENEYLNFLRSKRNLNGESDVHLNLANGSSYKHPGLIETVESEFDENTGTIAFRAKFPNPEKMLRHGATGMIQLPVRVEKAVILPQKSVVEIQDKNYVFLVDDSNRLTMKSFVPEMRFSKFFVVKSGLEPGEKILYEGTQDARDGMIIDPRIVPFDSLLVATKR